MIMSLKHTLLIPLLLTTSLLFSQTIYVVDQNPNAPSGDHVYADLQQCIDAASAGDIIHVIPALDNYGTVTIDKELHLVGAGWVPDIQSGLKSMIYRIIFEANTSNGSTLNGLIFTQTNDYSILLGEPNAPLDTLKNIEIFNCRVPGIKQLSNSPMKNITLRNNIFGGLQTTLGFPAMNFLISSGMTEDFIITNNIITVNYANGNVRASLSAANQTLIVNNLFYAQSGYYAFHDVVNCFITNNVFFGASASSYQYGATVGQNYNNVYSNNLSYNCTSYGGCDIPPVSTALPANIGNGNLPNTDPLYATLDDAWFWSVSNSLELLDFSPLVDGGTDGSDIGVTGGLYPFNSYENLRGVPYIHEMSVPGLILENQDLHLEAEARSNQ
jgi:hypothetical protein